MKHILITGGSGLIGSTLAQSLTEDGHAVTILSREPGRHRDRLPGQVNWVKHLEDIADDDPIDQVVNLAGEQIVGKRWTDARKQRIRESRIDLTRNLMAFLAGRSQPPAVIVSGSAIGYYGDQGDKILNESAPPAGDFGARLCVDWEAAAIDSAPSGSRVCLIRTGLVMARHGGMLEQLLLPFKLGLGARLGDGRQWMSWIHIDDQVAVIRFLLDQEQLSGAFNLTAPEPVTNAVFTKSLGNALNRPTFLFAPASAIRFGLGEAADLLLGGQRVIPENLQQAGFRFRFQSLSDALADLF